MFQATISKNESNFNNFFTMECDLFDKMDSASVSLISGEYVLQSPNLLVQFTSQATSKSKYVSFFQIGNNKRPRWTSPEDKYLRSIPIKVFYSTGGVLTENLLIANMNVGTVDFPLGFYDVTIYTTAHAVSNDPQYITSTLFNGVLNMEGSTASDATNFESVQYDKYTDNDTDTQSVYITF